MGREIGAPIPSSEPGTSGFKKDKDGEVVLTKLDEITLQQMALETGGSYVRSVTGDMDLQKIYLENIKHKVKKSWSKQSGDESGWKGFSGWSLPHCSASRLATPAKKLPPSRKNLIK